MSMSISIPHQHVRYASGEEGTVRGILATGHEGHAHGHVAFSSKAGSRRYRALSGAQSSDSTISIELEQLLVGPGVIELATLDVHVLGSNGYADTALDADIVLRSIPNAVELLRATVLLDIQETA